MNIFEDYLKKIINIIKSASENDKLVLPKDISSINVDVPPLQFDFDISTNVAMVLSKVNEKPPLELAEILKDLILENDKSISKLEIKKPGFINIKFNSEFWSEFSLNIVNDQKYGSFKKKTKKYLIEFVSANPTGPLHVGHCRGAILGDVISNLLLFNHNKIIKEYYVNDHGSQIIHFTKSVHLRILEILNKEKFPTDNPDLYPGEYLIDIAKNIIKKNPTLNFNNFNNLKDKLTELAVLESLNLIKINLNNLGIKHDNFASEKKK